MIAEILPLEGKYYGTYIRLQLDDGTETIFSIWSEGGGDPSQRELSDAGYTKKNWDDNILIDDGWGGKEPIQSAEVIDTPGGHYETQKDYDVCRFIVDAINERSNA